GKLVYEAGYNSSPTTARGSLSLSLAVNQLLYDGGKWWNTIAMAGAQERAARGQLDEQRLASEFEAVNRFYTLLNAQLALGVFENGVKRSQTQLDRARSLF